jgi:hypothetical protein
MTSPSYADHYRGPYGTAVELSLDGPRAGQTVCHWLLTAPAFHPLWSQYVLCCVRLDDVPGFPPPHRKFPGATHEFIVVALDPTHGPYDVAKMAGYAERGGGLPFLTPVNIAEQFTATDYEMRQVCALAASAVVMHAALNPETGDAPTRIREEWLASITKTLAHMRGEVHAP